MDTIRKIIAYIFMFAGGLGIFTFLLTDAALLPSGLFSFPVIIASAFLILVSAVIFLIGYRFYDRKIPFVEKILPAFMHKPDPPAEPDIYESEPGREYSPIPERQIPVPEPAEEFSAEAEELLKNKDLFTVILRRTDTPGLNGEDTIPLYTGYEEARSHCTDKEYAYRIPAEGKKKFFTECLICGYQNFILHDKEEYSGTIEDIERVFSLGERSRLGCIHPELIRKIRRYLCSQPEDRTLFDQINRELKKTDFVIRAEKKDDQSATLSVLKAKFPDGSEWASLFTDHYALERYLNRTSDSAVIPGLLKDTYNGILKEEDCSGIIINPGREEYKMDKKLLHELFAEKKDPSVKTVNINLEKDLFLMPVIFEGEDIHTTLSEPDYELHYFPEAARMHAEGSRINCIDLIPANYHDARKGRKEMMYGRLLKNFHTGKEYVPLFLSYETLTSMINTIHIAVISFKEAKKLSEGTAGIVVGPGIANQIYANTEKKQPASVPDENEYASLMCGQLVALYKTTHDFKYRDEYVRRLQYIGFTAAEAEGLFLFELMILKHDHIAVLTDPGYIGKNCFSMKSVLLPEKESYYTDHQIFLCSEIVKIFDEAEYRYVRVKDNPSVSEDVFNELYRISRYGGGELFMNYLKMISEKSHTDFEKIQKYAAAEQNLLFKYRWNTEGNEKHPYGNE